MDWYSLALGLCIGFGGCIEAPQLCPVIGRDCRVSTGRQEWARGSWQSCGSASSISESGLGRHELRWLRVLPEAPAPHAQRAHISIRYKCHDCTQGRTSFLCFSMMHTGSTSQHMGEQKAVSSCSEPESPKPVARPAGAFGAPWEGSSLENTSSPGCLCRLRCFSRCSLISLASSP